MASLSCVRSCSFSFARVSKRSSCACCWLSFSRRPSRSITLASIAAMRRIRSMSWIWLSLLRPPWLCSELASRTSWLFAHALGVKVKSVAGLAPHMVEGCLGICIWFNCRGGTTPPPRLVVLSISVVFSEEREVLLTAAVLLLLWAAMLGPLTAGPPAMSPPAPAARRPPPQPEADAGPDALLAPLPPAQPPAPATLPLPLDLPTATAALLATAAAAAALLPVGCPQQPPPRATSVGPEEGWSPGLVLRGEVAPAAKMMRGEVWPLAITTV
mmetsp:Transcript_31150/g.67015  ORF Transcript_31150/g.67015 Transcript_31150/m.67015 type:complete len:271 (+) Transcript_31150:314-1126(+)